MGKRRTSPDLKLSSKKSGLPSRRSQMSLDLEELVGGDVYSTWIRMLKELVPWGRTHRIALLDESADVGMDCDEQRHLVLPIIEQLFSDAYVKWKRKSSRGETYSIAEQAMDEFLRWDFMPWE